MSRTTQPRTRLSNRRGLMLAGGALALTSVAAGGYSLALFTSATTVGDNAFNAGTVEIGTDRAGSALISFANMMPGDYVTAPLTISNTGTGALRYSMFTKTSNELAGLGNQLQLQIKTLGKGCDAFDGELLYGNADPAATSGSPAREALDQPIATAALGDASEGQQAGDRLLSGSDNSAPKAVGSANRPDAASEGTPSSEVLCFRAYLPKYATGNEFQGAAVTASFEFVAEQTANNP